MDNLYKKKYLKYKKKYKNLTKGGNKCKNESSNSVNIIKPELWKNKKIDSKEFITVHNNSLMNLLIPSTKNLDNYHIFSNKIKDLNKISNQKNSGRCWMFAGLNVIRNKFINKYKLKDDFEFSQNYLFFWDKLERFNYCINLLEKLEPHNLPFDDRLISIILTNSIDDGGSWNMFSNLVNKYGLVPKNSFPETYHSSNSCDLNGILEKKIKNYAKYLRNNSIDKEKLLEEVYLLLVKFFGQPPTKFNWEYMDKKDKYRIKTDLTPHEFYKMADINILDYAVLVNDPRNKYNLNYSVEYLNNMIEGENVKNLNIEMDVMKKLVKKSIDNNEGVWFACDVSKFLLSKNNILDPEIYKVEEFLNISFDLNKSEKLLYYDTVPNHAMAITGYNLDKSTINRWQIENSWGTDSKNTDFDAGGYYSMTDEWMDEYVYEIVINKKYLPSNLKKKYNQNIDVVLPLWDPFGVLA